MKKIITLSGLILISIICSGQSVKLEDLIRHYLKKDDSLQLYKKFDIKKDSIIFSQDQLIKKDSSLIRSYRSDSIIYNKTIQNKDTELQNNKKVINLIKQEAKEKQKNLKLTIFGLSLLEIITILLLI